MEPNTISINSQEFAEIIIPIVKSIDGIHDVNFVINEKQRYRMEYSPDLIPLVRKAIQGRKFELNGKSFYLS